MWQGITNQLKQKKRFLGILPNDIQQRLQRGADHVIIVQVIDLPTQSRLQHLRTYGMHQTRKKKSSANLLNPKGPSEAWKLFEKPVLFMRRWSGHLRGGCKFRGGTVWGDGRAGCTGLIFGSLHSESGRMQRDVSLAIESERGQPVTVNQTYVDCINTG